MSVGTDFSIDVRDGGVRVVTQRSPETIFGPTLLTGTNQASTIIDVREARQIALLMDIDAGAASDVVSMFPVGSCSAEAPDAITDDEWFALPSASTVTAGLPSGITQLSGVDQTIVPEYGQVTVYPTEIKFAATDNASDEIRVAVVLDVTWCRYFAVLLADGSGAGTLATVKVQAVRVA